MSDRIKKEKKRKEDNVDLYLDNSYERKKDTTYDTYVQLKT